MVIPLPQTLIWFGAARAQAGFDGPRRQLGVARRA